MGLPRAEPEERTERVALLLRHATLGRFPRVAQSCSLLRTGTYPYSVSERLRITSTASVKHCQDSFYRELREAHDRTTARWPAAPWMPARAFAKQIKRCQEDDRENANGDEYDGFVLAQLQSGGFKSLALTASIRYRLHRIRLGAVVCIRPYVLIEGPGMLKLIVLGLNEITVESL